MATISAFYVDSYYVGAVIVSLFAAHFIAHRNQAIRLAGATLPQPTPPPKKPKDPTPTGLRRLIKRIKSGAAALTPMIPALVMNYVLPRIASQWIVDGFTVLFFGGAQFFFTGIACAKLAKGVEWTWNGQTPTLQQTFVSAEPTWLITAFAAVVSITFCTTQFYGYDYLSFLMMIPFTVSLSVNANRYNMKRLCKLVACLAVGLAVGIPSVFGAIALWRSHYPASTSTSSSLKMPSQWTVDLFLPPMFAAPIAYATFFLTPTLRFEASLEGNISLDDDKSNVVYHDERAIAPLGKHLTHSQKPLFNAGLVSHGITAVISYLIINNFAKPEERIMATRMCGMLASVVTVPLGIAFRAWQLGLATEWYNYDEQPLYRGVISDETENQAMDDVEKLLDEKL